MRDMERSGWRGLDPAPIAAALTALATLVLYLWGMRQEGDQPVVWLLGGLALSVPLCCYGSALVPMRRLALTVAGAIMAVLGLLGHGSIGLPVLVAGVAALHTATQPHRSELRRRADGERPIVSG